MFMTSFTGHDIQEGANDTYSKKMGGGAGITWSLEKLVASVLFVSEDASNFLLVF